MRQNLSFATTFTNCCITDIHQLTCHEGVISMVRQFGRSPRQVPGRGHPGKSPAAAGRAVPAVRADPENPTHPWGVRSPI